MNVTVEDYKRAEMFLPWNLEKRVLNSVVIPYFLEKDDRFWYLRKTREGKEFIIVDVAKNTQKPLFSHERLARALSTVLSTTIAGTNLPFDELEIDEERQTIQFDVKKQGFKCEETTYKCTPLKHPVKSPPGELRSPDGQWAAFLRDHNLFVRNMETDEELQLTFDGEPHYAYGTPSESNLQTVTDRRAGILPTPVGIWSADSNRLLTQRLDERKVGELHLLQSVPKQGYGRPILYSYRYPLLGDSVTSRAELIIMDIEPQKQIPIQGDPVLASPKSILEAIFEGAQWAWWSDDGSRIYYLDQERGYTSLRLHAVDTSDGKTQTLISESDTTYLNPNPSLFLPPNVRVLGDGGEFIWFSQRDGWGHLYLYDGTTGRLKHPITTGDYLVRDIKHVDEQRRQIYFTAAGREPLRDAYFRHLYRASLDGSSPELLTPEDADHWVRFSPNGHYFVDTYTWGSDVPTTVLRDAQGKLIRTIERADIDQIVSMGWQPPQRFRVKARDGKTDIYGMLYRPTNFDSSKSYPIIDDIYPGPQTIKSRVALPGDLFRQSFDSQPLAELGFIVIHIDGMGTPFRSKAFGDVSYGNLEDAGGLADHMTGLLQLAQRYPYMDLDRVGITGHSGGGYASTRAILAYPDFYKVAFASAGNHDMRSFLALWGEHYQGLPNGDNYLKQANASLAENLQGKLLLAYGDLDENVHPALTIQLIDALIQANKDFDVIVLPNRNHGSAKNDPYLIRRRWDYFVRHLMGVEPPAGYKISKPTDN